MRFVSYILLTLALSACVQTGTNAISWDTLHYTKTAAQASANLIQQNAY